VFGDFDIVGIPFFPSKANPVSIVDSKTMPALEISGERFETIAGRDAEIRQALGRVQGDQAPQGGLRQMGQAFHKTAFEQPVRVRIAERLDHDSIVVPCTLYVKRKTGSTVPQNAPGERSATASRPAFRNVLKIAAAGIDDPGHPPGGGTGQASQVFSGSNVGPPGAPENPEIEQQVKRYRAGLEAGVRSSGRADRPLRQHGFPRQALGHDFLLVLEIVSDLIAQAVESLQHIFLVFRQVEEAKVQL
jgi:hypothetical protein